MIEALEKVIKEDEAKKKEYQDRLDQEKVDLEKHQGEPI
jgi:hypothetical protein